MAAMAAVSPWLCTRPSVAFRAPLSTVKNAEWKSNLHKRLSLDGPDMLSELFNRVPRSCRRIPRPRPRCPSSFWTSRERRPKACRSAFGACFSFFPARGVPLVSNFAKEMSSDRLGAAVHAGDPALCCMHGRLTEA